MAQTFSFAFSLAALDCALSSNPRKARWSLFLLALAVGCRPLQAIFFPILFALLYQHYYTGSFWNTVRLRWSWLIAPAIVAISLCAYNAVRFGNILEFGHNYLPEFLESPKGQFNLSYIPYNLFRCIRLYEKTTSGIAFPKFDGFAFYLVMPIYISAACVAVKNLRKLDLTDVLVILCLFLHLLALCSHKTMGGWHFGCRYLIDGMPFAYLLFIRRVPGNQAGVREKVLFGLGLLINVAGTALFYLA